MDEGQTTNRIRVRMTRVSIVAMGMAILLNSVMGISYYYQFKRQASFPLLGSWLFVACIAAVLQSEQLFPKFGHHCSSLLCQLAIETIICWITLDVMLVMVWWRIESFCHTAIIGILPLIVTDCCLIASIDYWLMSLATSIIAGCLLWITLWLTALPTTFSEFYDHWHPILEESMRNYIRQLDEYPIPQQDADGRRIQ